jgi:hypothetical protein
LAASRSWRTLSKKKKNTSPETENLEHDALAAIGLAQLLHFLFQRSVLLLDMSAGGICRAT